MMRQTRHGVLCAVFFIVQASMAGLYAQNRDQQIRERVDSLLTARYYRTPYDTNYVVRPEGRLTLKIRLNQSGNDLLARGTVNGLSSKADLRTSHKTTFSVAATYRGLSAIMSREGSE